MEALNDLKIMGESVLGGGLYRKVNVMGELTLSGRIESQALNIMGNLYSSGELVCLKAAIMGNVEADRIEIKEKGSIMGVLKARQITGENISLRGEINCSESLECAKLKINGRVDDPGFLGAEDLKIKSKWLSRVKEMGGKTLHVRGRRFSSKCVLQADTIEFDEIDINCVEAKIIRGKNITIGPNCNIDLVECSGNLTVHLNAKVKETTNL